MKNFLKYKLNKTLFFILSIFFISQKNGNLSSEKAYFDGEFIKLKGNINISCPLGNLQAKEAYLKKKSLKKKNPTSIYLKDDVFLILEEKIINSKRAKYNSLNNTIKFFENVCFKDKKQEPFIVINSDFANCYKDSIKNKELKQKTFHETNLSKSGNELKNLKVSFENATGFLKKNLKNTSFFYFQAKNIIFTKEQVDLKNHVSLKNENYLLNSENISIFLENKKPFKITVFPNSTISFKNSKINSKNPILFNLLKNEIKTKGDSKIIFQNKETFFEAKKATLLLNKNNLEIEKIFLEKDLFLRSKKFKNMEIFSIADYLECIPSSNTLILKNASKNKVLFWQKENNFSLSANKIKLWYNQNEKEPKIQGYGNVRFSFNQEERHLMQKKILKK